ncbi:GNAT family N-acetyltransferase [Flavobacterium sp. XN-5]|nr:GNAT family N-acetyltransferase [Flavobacterium sp. XN-5]
MTPQLERLGFGNFTIIRKFNGVKIGCCGLYDREAGEGIDIGFAFLPKYENKGYGFESTNTLKEAAFAEFNLMGISAITAQRNISSQKLLVKIGLQFEKNIKLIDDSEQLLLFKLLV